MFHFPIFSGVQVSSARKLCSCRGRLKGSGIGSPVSLVRVEHAVVPFLGRVSAEAEVVCFEAVAGEGEGGTVKIEG